MTHSLPLLAQGRTAEIYAWDEEWVLKLFRPWMSPASAEYERQLARRVQTLGVPAPAVGDLVIVDGRTGLIYERIDGPTLAARLRAQPWRLIPLARLLADLHAEIHACSAPDLPDQRQRLARKIEAAGPLPADARRRLLDRLDSLPAADRICHGDFHPLNVILAAGGPVVIDWADATAGTPAADVARTLLLGQLARHSLGLPAALFYRLVLGAYRRRYRRHAPKIDREIARWLPLVAAARLTENVPGEAPHLLRLI